MKIDELIRRLDEATTAIASRLSEILSHDKLSTHDSALLEEDIARLEEMGKNPDNPVPADPPSVA